MMIQNIAIASLVALLGANEKANASEPVPCQSTTSASTARTLLEEETWTDGSIGRISEQSGAITKFRFDTKDEDGNIEGRWVEAGGLSEEEENVLRRLRDSDTQGVSIGVERATSNDDWKYNGKIEYSS